MADPSVDLSYDPKGPQFEISEQCVMPTITVTATLKDITVDPKVAPQYQWDVTVEFKGSTACVHSMTRTTSHAAISQSTGPKNQFVIPFTQVRGGELTVKVAVTVGATVVKGQSKGLTIVGTNPIVGSLIHDAPNKAAFRKLMSVESPGLIQFLSPGCPRFSGDNFGGVGLCQLTYPQPTDDQIWSWKENLKGGIKLWNEKEATAKKVPAEVRKGAAFQALVTAYNAQRAATAAADAKKAGKAPEAVPPITVTLPDYTADQVERETLRLFNGDIGLHEFRVKVDSNGLLVVTLDKSGTSGAAEWEEVSAADRVADYDKRNIDKDRRGDPNYVEKVEAQASF